MEWAVAAGALLLAFVNGANDNMKGAATLYGSGALGYRAALGLATVSTAFGSLASAFLAGALAETFSARGLVPDAALTPEYLAAVALGASAAVLLATRLGLPVSTTHALVGAVAGAGAVAAGAALDLSVLGGAFVTPLVAGPLLAIAVAFALVRAGRGAARRLGVGAETCVCLERAEPALADAGGADLAAPEGGGGALAHAGGGLALAAPSLALVVEPHRACATREGAHVLGFELARLVEVAHVLSASLVGFARGLNDTPKILGLVASSGSVSPEAGSVALGGAMALGGWLGARRVAETLAKELTPMEQPDGLAANAATSLLVASASPLGLPLSTTHVSAGGIFAVGAARGELRWSLAGELALAWLVTLPLAAALAGALMWVAGLSGGDSR